MAMSMQSGAELMHGVMRSAAKRKADATYRIDGEYLSTEQIAARLDLTQSVVQSRMRKLRNASGPITLARLAAG